MRLTGLFAVMLLRINFANATKLDSERQKGNITLGANEGLGWRCWIR